MDKGEFITQFDIYYNSIASNTAPSVNNYEKSVFLTQAQKDIMIELYNGRNIAGLSFESTEEARAYLREMISSKEYNKEEIKDTIILPDNCWFITLEECKYNTENKCLASLNPTVVPVKQDEVVKLLKNPFRGPSIDRVLRADVPGGLKLYSTTEIGKYKITFIRQPGPIILESLKDYNLTIDGQSEPLDPVCELNPILHKAILERAVRLAKIAYMGN